MSQKACAACHALNDIGSSYCGRCGAPLRGENEGASAYHPPADHPAASSTGTPTNTAEENLSSGEQPGVGGYHPGAGGYQSGGGGYQPGVGGDQPGTSGSPTWGNAPFGAAGPAGYLPAGFWIRLGAHLIDGLILTAVDVVLGTGGQSGLLTYASILYFVCFWAIKGQTPGKMALGLYVIGSDGQPIGWGKAVLRYVGYIASAIILGIGFIMIGFDDLKRGLHDRMASTLVVRKVA